MNQPLVYLVDDNNEFRESTSWVLEGEGYTVIDFNDPVQALKSILEAAQDCASCCLLDIRMPNMSGLEFHDQLISKNIKIPIIYMTGHGDVPLAVEAMSKGAVTFLEKPLDHNILNSALNSAFKIAKSKTSTVIKYDDRVGGAEYQQRLNNLTRREQEVLSHIVSGKMNKVIALELGISVKTVELHRSRVMAKMHAKTAADLVKMVLTNSVN